jgi:hypothetical protein
MFAFILSKVTYSLGHVFYVSLFAPLIFAIFIFYFLKTGLFFKSVIIITFLLVGTGIVRTALLFPSFVAQGATLDNARKQFEVVINQRGRAMKIGLTGGLWALTEEYYNTYPYASLEKLRDGTALIFFQQRYSGMLTPPPIEGCALFYDRFSKEIPRMFGVRLANTMPGYGYAIYDCSVQVKNETLQKN